ncbi:hypothetical protein PR048_008288 [Dryococelus australis]|uniref:Uncharacterized protein n=1 Tax=Dryococelus australis TaxID=614101 RepID=A0ABQ9HWP6_9NEOP|nr:hypothetical protein PR048_008288 [Dryococelus australis]
MKGRGKREIPKKIRRPVVSFGTIPTCEKPGATPPGIEPGSPSWEASGLTTKPPGPQVLQAAHEAVEDLKGKLCGEKEEYVAKGSGWMLASVDCLELRISRLYSLCEK